MAGPMPPEGGEAPGGASQIVADIHSGLLKLQELVEGKFPQEAQQLAQITSQYQQFVEGLGQAPGGEPQGEPMPGTTTPEAGAANVKPAM